MGETIRILINEQDSGQVRSIESELRAAGVSFAIERVTTEQDFARSLATFGPDIVVMEYHQPAFDGLAALRHVQAHGPGIPVIMMSGSWDETVVMNAVRAGASDWVLRQERGRIARAILGALERKRVSEKNVQGEHIFDTVFHVSPAIMVISTFKEGRYLAVNEAFEQVIGYSRDEVIGRTSVEQNMYAGKDERLKLVRELIRKGGTSNLEIRFRARSGRVITGLTSATRIGFKGHDCFLTVIDDITERKKAEDALKESKAWLESVFNSSLNNITVTDMEGNIIDCNPAAVTMFGAASKEELIGKSVFSFISEQDRQRVIEMKRALEQGMPHSKEYRMVSLDGRELIVDISASVIRGKDGHPAGLMAVVQDITERKKAEDALRESKAWLEGVFNSSPNNITVTDMTGKIIDCNPAAVTMVGATSKEELIGKNAFTLIAEKDRRRAIGNMRKTLEQGVTHNKEYTQASLDGRERIVDISASVIRGKEGHPIGFMAVTMDITERKKIENDLRESEKKYRDLFERMLNGFAYHRIVADEQGRPIDYIFLEVNSEFERQTGLKRAEIINKRVTEAIPNIREDSFDWIGAYGRVALRGEELRVEQFSKALNRWYSAAAYSPKKGYFAAVFEDITERKKAEMRVRESYDKLQRTISGIINAISKITETRDPYTAGHQRRVTQLATAIAHELGLPEDQINTLRIAAIIHDIGKIYIHAEILSKPGPLSEVEHDIIRIYPRASFDILRMIEFPGPVAQIALQHQERCNGSGYPAGLAGEEIVFEARILTVADVVEAMVSHRPYRQAKNIDEVLDELIRNKGILYDPREWMPASSFSGKKASHLMLSRRKWPGWGNKCRFNLQTSNLTATICF
jgi:PAS domain S-box-containing protein